MTVHEVKEEDKFIVMASDGVWELIESQKVAEIVQSVQSGDVQEICEEITQHVRFVHHLCMPFLPTIGFPRCRLLIRAG